MSNTLNRICIKHALRGDLIYRLYTVIDEVNGPYSKENERWWEIEFAHRTLFDVLKMRIDNESVARTIFEELTDK